MTEERCTNCGATQGVEASFCGSCGTPALSTSDVKCPQCGTDSPYNARFCDNCGQPLQNPEKGATPSEIGINTASSTPKLSKENLPDSLDEGLKPTIGHVKGANVSNGTVWVLALAPLIGLMLEYFIAGIIYADSPDFDWDVFNAVGSGQLFFVTVILNIALSILDERKLRKAGWDTNKIRGMVWLVPVYLFKRAKLLEQNLAYFIVWLVAFGLVFLNIA
jgi:ribosomal protein L40E